MSSRALQLIPCFLGLLYLSCLACTVKSPGPSTQVTDTIKFLVDQQTSVDDPRTSKDPELRLIRADGSVEPLKVSHERGGHQIDKDQLRGQRAVVFSQSGFGMTVWRINQDLESFQELSFGILKPIAPAEMPKSDPSQDDSEFQVRQPFEVPIPRGAAQAPISCVVRGLGVDGRSRRSVLLLLPGALIWTIRSDGVYMELGRTDTEGRLMIPRVQLERSVFVGASSEFYFDGGWLIEDGFDLDEYGEMNISLAPFFVR